jgi:hypothetical protein
MENDLTETQKCPAAVQRKPEKRVRDCACFFFHVMLFAVKFQNNRPGWAAADG